LNIVSKTLNISPAYSAGLGVIFIPEFKHNNQKFNKLNLFTMKIFTKDLGFAHNVARSPGLGRIILSFLILFVLTNLELMAAGSVLQPRPVTGTVLDENGEPLIGATVIVKGTNNGTISGVNGKFTLNVDGPDAVLVVSSVGYSTVEIAVGSLTEVTVNMQVDLIGLDEVVVIGYGTVKKSDLTGSVSSLKSEDFQPGAISSADELLMGRAAGVQVIQSSSEPGGAMAIRVRGASSINAGNEPLYVIDGLPIDNSQVTGATGNDIPGTRTPRNPLATLNPSDIASIEVLKDASATAIYGARGANGVIMITTKKGSQGKMKVSYNAYYGMQSPAKKLDMLTATEYQQVLNDILDDGGGNPEERVTEIVDGGTDWQDELMRNAPVQSHNLSLAGGDEATKYYVSLNYFDQQGIVVSSGMKRYDARINLDHQVGDKFRTGINFTPSFIKDDFVSYGYAINEQAGAIYAAINFDPTLPVKDDNGVYTISPYITIDNPLALAYGEENNQVAYRTMGTVYGEYFILPSWSVKLNLGVDYQSKRRDAFVSSLTKTGGGAGGKASVISGLQSNYLVEVTTNYNRVFGDIHGINILAGFTAQEFMNSVQESYAQGFSQEITKTNALQAGDPTLFDLYTGKSSHTLQSYIGRVNYTLMDKYLLTATIRADGSSRFGENNKWGYFPSVAFAWKMSDEIFIQDIDAVSNMKFRASWGRTGNQAIGNYQSLTTFVTGADATFDQSLFTSYAPSRVGNPDLKWETTEQINFGLDIGILKNRIFATIDWYRKNTFDMLIYLPTPASTGFTSILQNIGSIKNSGFEFLVNTTNIVGEFTWSSSLNFTTLRNEVTDLGPIPEIIHIGAGWSDQIAIITPGEPLNSFYGWKVLGVWQEDDDFGSTTDPVVAGDTKYEDLNGDGTVNAEDKQILGNSFPDFTWGMNNTFTFKGFDLTIFLEGVHGIQMLNNNKVDSYFPINFRRNKYAEPYLNRWTTSNPTNDNPSFVNPNGQGNKAVNSWTVEDASYIKIRNVKLGYTFNVGNVSWLQSANVYVSGQNLVTWTDYDGFDPANNSNGEASIKIDYNSYPVARTWIVGVNVTF
jgi:TonB-linked SusC/RagA family outer membrane protein